MGDTACAWAEALAHDGWSVAGTVRGAAKQAELGARGWAVHRFDGEACLPDDALSGSTHVLVSIPPDEAGDPVLERCLPALRAAAPAWIGYLSSTGVYGDHEGAWVDEDTPLRPPSGARAQRRQRAEARWRELASALPIHVFRLAGLYGPGRNALLRVQAGHARRLDKPGHVFSRVHRADVLQVLDASVASPRPGRVYNVADQLPAPAHEVTAYACELLGLDPPPLEPFDAGEVSPALAGFYSDSKRVLAQRILGELGVELRFPTYREGLRALADSLG